MMNSKTTPEKLEILFILNSTVVGGTERQALLLAKELLKTDIKLSVFAFDASGPITRELKSLGVEVRDGKRRFTKSTPTLFKIFFYIGAAFRLWWYLQEKKPDVIHSWLSLSNFYATVTNRLSANAKTVISFRAMLAPTYAKSNLSLILDKISARLADEITCNAREIADQLTFYEIAGGKSTTVIANGVDIEKFKASDAEKNSKRLELNISDQDFVLVHVANLLPNKGHSDLIDAISLLKKSLVGTSQKLPKLFCVGRDVGMEAILIEKCNKLGIEDTVSFLGERNDVPLIMQTANLGIIASHEEGLPNAAIEMLCAGLPIIATRVGGVPDLARTFDTIYLVDKHNPKQLCQKIGEMLNSRCSIRSSRESLTSKIMDNFSPISMADAYIRLYTKHRARG